MPYGVEFAPNGNEIAVGYEDSTNVDVLSATTLKKLFGSDTASLDNGNLHTVAFSVEGGTLFAAGSFSTNGAHPVFAWDGQGKGARQISVTDELLRWHRSLPANKR